MGEERKTMQQYLDALTARADNAQCFTDDVVVTVVGSEQRAEGRRLASNSSGYAREGIRCAPGAKEPARR
jgi:hypothetical protein